jgi:RND family efflux transporter MFP subunit
MKSKRFCFRIFCGITLALAMQGSIWAHGDEDHSAPPAKKVQAAGMPASHDSAVVQRLSDGGLFVPKQAQRQLSIRTQVGELKDWPATIELNGKVLADPNAGGRVQASQAGRVEPGAQGLPALGQQVSKGQVMAYLRPVMSSLDKGNTQSLLADIESKLAIAERKAKRYEELGAALPRATIEAARDEYEGLKKRRVAVEASMLKSEALIAPVSGIISVANAVSGQVVDAKETLFEIIDPNRLMVEALAYEHIAAGAFSTATAVLGNSSIADSDDLQKSLSLKFIGGGQQMREQAIPLLFKVTSAHPVAAVGQALKVIAQTKRMVNGIQIPNAALVKGAAGQSMVWLHTEAERFEQRAVKVQSIDGSHLVVLSGLKEGERVVTSGASLLGQVR